jgi:hypothetical protein
METMRLASWNGKGFSNTAFTTEKIAVLAPIPKASVITVTVANPGLLRNWRNA